VASHAAASRAWWGFGGGSSKKHGGARGCWFLGGGRLFVVVIVSSIISMSALPREPEVGAVVAVEEEYSLESFAADLAILEADPAVKALLYDDGSNKSSLREYKKRVEGELHNVEVESVRGFISHGSFFIVIRCAITCGSPRRSLGSTRKCFVATRFWRGCRRRF
jgi:hypothetical protein